MTLPALPSPPRFRSCPSRVTLRFTPHPCLYKGTTLGSFQGSWSRSHHASVAVLLVSAVRIPSDVLVLEKSSG